MLAVVLVTTATTGRGGSGIGSAHPCTVSTSTAPCALTADCEFGHASTEVSPGEDGGGLPEERICLRGAGVGGGAVVEEEANADVVGGGVAGGGDGRIGDEFEYHG